MDQDALKAFCERFDGKVLRPGDGAFEETRSLFNAMIQTRPAVIAQCTSVSDVQTAIRFGREQDLEIAVRCGGHSVAGMSLVEDGLVIDLRPINHVAVDPATRTARVGGGAHWRLLDEAAGAHGLATTGGRVSTTGIGGFTLGGGSGWFERKLGFAADRLLAVELVLADGTAVRASAEENSDLFWAARGGGGNFGVATAFEFRLDPLPEVLAGLIFYTPDKAEEVLRHYRDFAEQAPDELGGGALFLTAPPEEFIPEHLQGQVLFAIGAMWAGDPTEGQKALRPIIEHGSPDATLLTPVPYAEFQHMLDDPPGLRNYWTAEYFDTFPDDAAKLFCEYGRKMKPSSAQLALIPWGGAVARADAGETPLGNRDSRWVFHPFALWESEEDDEFWISWARGSNRDLGRFGNGGAWLNFIGHEGEERIRGAYGKHYDRLAEIKGRYDPENVFHRNQNIKPKR